MSAGLDKKKENLMSSNNLKKAQNASAQRTTSKEQVVRQGVCTALKKNTQKTIIVSSNLKTSKVG